CEVASKTHPASDHFLKSTPMGFLLSFMIFRVKTFLEQRQKLPARPKNSWIYRSEDFRIKLHERAGRNHDPRVRDLHGSSPSPVSMPRVYLEKPKKSAPSRLCVAQDSWQEFFNRHIQRPPRTGPSRKYRSRGRYTLHPP